MTKDGRRGQIMPEFEVVVIFAQCDWLILHTNALSVSRSLFGAHVVWSVSPCD